MSILANKLLYKSHTSIQIINILDFGETLTIHGLDAMLMLSKICIDLIINSITLKLIGMLVSEL